MKILLKTCTIILLLFNAIGAMYGGYHLMRHPDGGSLGLSLILLRQSGFQNYFIPALILFICNGVYGIFVTAAVAFNSKYNALLVIVQGSVLAGWIAIQLLLIQTFSPFHIILCFTGILLIVLGSFRAKRIDQYYPVNSVL